MWEKSLFNSRSHTFRRAVQLKIQVCQNGLPKPGGTHQERHTWEDPGNIRALVRWEQVPWQNSHHLRLEGYLEALAMVSIDIKHDFTGDGEKILLLTTEVLLRAAAGELAKSKNIRNWTSMNVVVLPPFLTEIALTDGETAAEAIIKIFAERTNRQEAENAAE